MSRYKTILEDLTGEREDRIERSKNRLTFGISFADDAMVGISKQDIVVLAGRSGQGKSEMALHIALMNALRGFRVCHIALEAESREISRRLLFKQIAKRFWADPEHPKAKPKYLNWVEGEQEEVVAKYYDDAVSELERFDNLKIVYRGEEFGLKEITQVFASMKNEADLIILDHLHYMDIMGEQENRAYTEMIKEIRRLALFYSIPVIVVAHVRKADPRSRNPVPEMEDIHGSSDIYKNATKVITIAPAKDQKPEPGTENTRFPTYMKICKCRRDSSLTWYVGLLAFDNTKAVYDDEYIVGKIGFDGEFKPVEQNPDWAKRGKTVPVVPGLYPTKKTNIQKRDGAYGGNL